MKMRIATFIVTVFVLCAAVSASASRLKRKERHAISKRDIDNDVVKFKFMKCGTYDFAIKGAIAPSATNTMLAWQVLDGNTAKASGSFYILAGDTKFETIGVVPMDKDSYSARLCMVATGECKDVTFAAKCNIEEDPHLTTFDGVKFNFQGLCTYVLTQDCRDVTNPSFQITADFRGKYSELREKPLTRVDAVNINVGGIQLVRILKNNHFLIKGELFTNSSAVIGNGEGTITVIGYDVFVDLNKPKISIKWAKDVHGVLIDLKENYMTGNVCGLLGNSNDKPDDEFMKPNGEMLTKADIYEFGNSWEVPDSCP